MIYVDDKLIKRLIILGHTSFIGRHLTKKLWQQCPEIEIIGKSTRDINLTCKKEVEKLSHLIDSNTIVIMLSANTRQSDAGINDFAQNIEMTENLCRLMHMCPPKRFVFFSAEAVYGEDTQIYNITESTPVVPTSYYGMAKFIAERLFWKTFDSLEQSSILTLRMPRIYGPGANSNDYGPTMFSYKAIKKNPIGIWGDGLELRDYVFIDDLTDIVNRLTFNSFDGMVNIASGATYSFIDVLKVVEGVCEYKIKVNYKRRTRPKVNRVFNNDNLKTLIGNYKFTPLNKGINALCQYLRSNKASNELNRSKL